MAMEEGFSNDLILMLFSKFNTKIDPKIIKIIN